MGKKSLSAGIVLIILSTLILIGIIGGNWKGGGMILEIFIFAMPMMIGGILLLRKYSRTRKTQKQFEVSPAKSKAVPEVVA